jgi:hypothetical protein
MKTEAIVCDMPAANAVKIESLTCEIRDVHFIEGWGLAATSLSAIATVVLAVFAIAAWRASVRNHELMQEQIEAVENVARIDRQYAALKVNVDALIGLLLAIADSNVRSAASTASLTSAGKGWRMQHWKSPDEMEKFGLFETFLLLVSPIAKEEVLNGGLDRLERMGVTEAVHAFIKALEDWQTERQPRATTMAEFDELFKVFRRLNAQVVLEKHAKASTKQ